VWTANLLTATCALACELAHATLDTLHRLDRLLGYASAHRNGHHLYHAFDMNLENFADASYLSRPRARSVAGSYHHLTRAPAPGFTHDPLAFINGPISCHSTQIPVAVQESEYARLFAAAKIGDVERRILHDLGYPQLFTLILYDNECPNFRKASTCVFIGSRIGSSSSSFWFDTLRAPTTLLTSSRSPYHA
jgi:hypothetical protein